MAVIGPEGTWRRRLLRLLDTAVGIAIGLAGKWVSSLHYCRGIGRERGEQVPSH